MKKVRKIIFIAFSLLMICLTLSLVNQKADFNNAANEPESENMGATLPTYIPFSSINGAYKGGIRLVYTTNLLHEADSLKGDTTNYVESLADVVSVGGKKTIYVSYYFVVEVGSKGTAFFWDLSDLTSAGISYTIYSGDDVLQAYDDDAFDWEDTPILSYRDYSKWVTRTFSPTVASENFGVEPKFMQAAGNQLQAQFGSSSEIGPGEYLMGKLELEIPDSVSSFSMDCVKWVAAYGSDTNNVTGTNNNPSQFAVGLGAGAQSTSTVTVGTWELDVHGTQYPLTVSSKKFSLELPAELGTNSTVSMTYTVDGGKGSVDSISTGDGSWISDYEVSVPAKGGKATATINVVAQDGTTTDSYDLEITRRSSDIDNVTLVAKDKSGNTKNTIYLSDLNPVSGSANTYELPNNLTWDITELATTVALEGSSATVTTPTGTSLGASSTSVDTGTIEFKVTELGVTTTYKINWKRDSGDNTTTITKLNVYNGSSTVALKAAQTQANGDIVYELNDEIGHTVLSLTFEVLLPKTSQTITVGSDTTWTGSPAKTMSTIGDKGQNNTTANSKFTQEFTVVSQLGTTQKYIIKGERAYLKSTSTNMTGKWSGSSNPSNVVLVTDPSDPYTLRGTIPANNSSSTITVVLTTDGNGTNALDSNITGSWSVGSSAGTYTVALPAKGSNVSAKFISYAQSYHAVNEPDAKQEYTVILERRTNDVTSIDVECSETTQGETGITLNSAGVFNISDFFDFEWDAENINVKVNLASTDISVKYNSSTSNPFTVNIGAPSAAAVSTSFKFDTYENGIKTGTYEVLYKRDPGDDNTEISQIIVWDPADATTPLGISLYANPDLNGKIVYKLDDTIPYELTSLNFKVVLDDGTVQHIVYDGDNNWDGTTPKVLSTGLLGNNVDHDFSVEFYVYGKVGAGQTYVIKGTRKGANNDVSLTGKLTGTTQKPDGSYETYLIPYKSPVGNTTNYDTEFVLDESDVKFELNLGSPSTSKLYFGTSSNPTDEWNSTTAANSYAVGTHATPNVYYAKVVAQNGDVHYYVFKLYHVDNRAKDYTLTSIKVYGLKGSGASQTQTELYPVTSATDNTSKPFVSNDTGPYCYNITYKEYDAIKIVTVKNSTALGVYSDTTGTTAVTERAVSSLTVGENDFYYYVKAENETFNNPYQVTIIKAAGRTGSSLTQVSATTDTGDVKTIAMSDARLESGVYKIDVPLAYGTTQATLDFKASAGAETSVTAPVTVNIPSGGKKSQTVVVTPEDGPSVTYEFIFYSTEEGDGMTINPIRVLDTSKITLDATGKITSTVGLDADLRNSDGDKYYDFNVNDYTNTIEINVPYSVSELYLYALINKTYAIEYGTGLVSLPANSGAGSTVTRVVYAESHYSTLNPNVTEETNKYTFKITRLPANTEKDIKTFAAYYGSDLTTPFDGTMQFAIGATKIKLGEFDADNYNKVTVKFTLETPNKATVLYNGAEITPNLVGEYEATLPLSFNASGLATDTIYVVDEIGNPTPYTIEVSANVLPEEVMPVITGITIKGDKTGTSYLAFNAGELQPADPIELDKNEDSVTITVTYSGTDGGFKIDYILTDGTTGTKTSNDSIITNVGSTVVKIYPFTSAGPGDKYVYELKREEPSKINTITDITVNDETDVPGPTGNVQFDVPSGKTSVDISLQPGHPSQKVVLTLPDGSTVNGTIGADGLITTTVTGLIPGGNQILVTVTPEDDDPSLIKTYTIDVNVDHPTALDTIKIVSMDETITYALTPSFVSGTTKYEVEIPYNVEYVKVIYELPSGYTSNLFNIVGAGPNASPYTLKVLDGTNPHYVVVSTIAGASDPTTYQIDVKKLTAQVGNQLLTVDITVPDKDGNPKVITVDGFSPEKTSYDVAIPANTPSYEFTNITVSPGATYKVSDNTTLTNNDKNPREIIVTSQEGKDNKYTFNLYVANTECEITYIKILDSNNNELIDLDNKKLVFSATEDEYSLRVANSVSFIKVYITYSVTSTLKFSADTSNNYTGALNTITVPLDNVGSANPNEIVVQALSQLYILNNSLGATDVSLPYQISIVREDLDSDNTLSRLELYVSSANKIDSFESTVYNYTVDDLGQIATVRLVAETTSAKAKISSISTVSSSLVGVRTFDGGISLEGILSSSLTATIVVTVQAENGKTQDYQIMISRGALEPDKDNTVADIKLEDNDGNSYISFVSTETLYEKDMPVGTNYYTITASKLNGSYATMYITTETGTVLSTTGSYTENITQAIWGKTLTYYVYAMAQDSATGKGTQYVIKVTILKPSDDDSLVSLKVDGAEQITPDNQTGPYIIGVPYETEKVHLYVESTHANAQIKVKTNKATNIYSDYESLKVGVNFINVEVYAEDGITFTQYVIEVTRAAEAPKLDTLEVNGEYLRDELGNRILFDPTINKYFVIIPYEKQSVEIIATSTMGVVHGTGVKQVNVGSQDFSVQVVAANGMSSPYTVNVYRLPESYSNSFAEYIKINEIKEFNDAFKPIQTSGYSYTVPNKVTDLTVSVKLQFEDDNVNDSLAAKYEVYGADNLRVGKNNVVVVVTSADGTKETTYLIQVTREPKQYDVNNKDEAVKNYTLEANKDSNGNVIHNEYIVTIGNKKTSDVDFSKFIENLNPTSQNLQVDVITDVSTNPDEVVVRITDGDETEFVKFQVKSTGNPTGFQGEEWTFLLLLGIILIVLLAILFTVNKDKYGKITKKTNRRNERKEKKEDAKRK